jgi:hypothetical protein
MAPIRIRDSPWPALRRSQKVQYPVLLRSEFHLVLIPRIWEYITTQAETEDYILPSERSINVQKKSRCYYVIMPNTAGA